MRKSIRKTQSGFTLVEIAIVLVIIGLLLGGVLKGQELVNSAKVKSLANDFRSISSFVYAYQDRFRATPGDDRNPSSHVAGGTLATTPGSNSIGNSRINGHWNSRTVTDESFLFWQHIRLAGLAAGTPTINPVDDYLQRNAEGGVVGITGDVILTNPSVPYPASFYVCSEGIQGRFARQIDAAIDDGNTQTGAVRVMANGVTSQPNATLLTPNDDATLYTVCHAF